MAQVQPEEQKNAPAKSNEVTIEVAPCDDVPEGGKTSVSIRVNVPEGAE
jgi:hypothetical protein